MRERGTTRPSEWDGDETMSNPPRPTRQLTAAERRIVAAFTKGDIGRMSLEYCVAVLLREGMDLHALPMLENLTRARLRETAESVMRRVALGMDRPETPPNAGAIASGYRRSLRQARDGAKPMAYLLNGKSDAEAPSPPQDQPCERLIDWDDVEAGRGTDAAELN